MDIRVLPQEEVDEAAEGTMTLRVELSRDDVAQLEDQASKALAIEEALPAEQRSPLAGMGASAYTAKFVETRAVNDALEAQRVVPVAMPLVRTWGYEAGEPFQCEIRVVPRPEIGLTSYDPVGLGTTRIAKPGFSAKAGRDGSGDVEFIEDEKALRIELVKRLDSELPEPAIRALAAEYQYKFELELSARNIDPESYQLAHGLNEEQYDLMMARHALSDAHWNFALDAIFMGRGMSVTEDDLRTTFEMQCPGHGDDLVELHELRGDLHATVEKIRRGKALMWLKSNM